MARSNIPPSWTFGWPLFPMAEVTGANRMAIDPTALLSRFRHTFAGLTRFGGRRGQPDVDPTESGWITLGHGSYCDGGPTVIRYSGDSEVVTVGKFTSIAADVLFIPGRNHHVDWVTTSPLHQILEGVSIKVDHPWSRGPITVGNDVWIGRGAKILSGVNIGDGAVVGAYSVVTRDVAPYSLVAGPPATFRRFRFSESTVERLRTIRWWEWSDDLIAERASELLSKRVEDSAV